MRTSLQFWYIRFIRLVLRRRFMPVMHGPLKGKQWTTSMNYDYLTGTYLGEDEIRSMQHALAAPGAAFYDIGANVGYFSLSVAVLFPHVNIMAFEPVEEHLRLFRQHMDLNDIHRIQIFPMAVAGHTGKVMFSNLGKHEGNTYKKDSALVEEGVFSIAVDATTVDDFVAAGNKPPSLLKIDVEGAELDVLKGAKQTLEQYHPDILLATHDVHIAGIRQACVDFLEGMGYSLTPVGAHNKAFAGLDDYFATYKPAISN